MLKGYRIMSYDIVFLFFLFIGIVDPYERKWLKISKSSVPESGLGVFALKDIPANRTVAFYSGFLFKVGEQLNLYNKTCLGNTSRYYFFLKISFIFIFMRFFEVNFIFTMP